MPTLPSGLEVAVDPTPLRKLLLDYALPFNAHHLMGLQGIDDLFRWLDVLILKPAEALTEDERSNVRPLPEGAPSGLLGVPTGARLADWRAAAFEWSEDDRAAFSAFVEGRIRPAMVRALTNVRDRRERLLKTPTVAGAFACMWRRGIHPLQDEADVRRLPDEIREHVERVEVWLDENVPVYATPREVTLSEFEINWTTLAGSFRLDFDGDPLPDRFRLGLEITGWLHFRMPMFVSPFGAPASYPAIEFTNETRRAIDKGLRATFPRLHGCGIVRATGKEIHFSTPISERIVDRETFDAAKARVSAPGYSITVPTCAAGASP